MDERKVFQEVKKLKKELNDIIRELNDIAGDVRYEFRGVGNEKCASCIRNVASDYRSVVTLLSSIDHNDLR